VTSFVQRWCQSTIQTRIYGWPVYTFLLAIGQLMSASAFQLVLLTGSWTTSDMEFNAIGIVFIFATILWWIIYRNFSSVYVCSLPMLFFAFSLFLAGLPVGGLNSLWVKRFAVWSYTFASGAGSLYFTLNFGEEAGVNLTQWIFRAGVFEGIRQLWTMGLWYWSKTFPLDSTKAAFLMPSVATTVFSWIFTLFFIALAYILYYGLPACYRYDVPIIPMFYNSFKVRGLALWFVFSQFIQAYWLSGPYGRNWTFLWNQSIPSWQIFFIILLFVVVWILLLYGFFKFSQIHSWILPIFAVGLLSPRWAQMSWSTSNIGSGLYWPGGVGPYFSLSLWLWLAILDSIQCVGFSMMLLQTLTRIHVAAILMLSQVLGAAAFMLARATAPNSHGPGDVFPNVSTSENVFWKLPFFWIGLIFQIVVALGYLAWFRREQLSKP
jgi:alpha-1,3-glucan synthase